MARETLGRVSQKEAEAFVSARLFAPARAFFVVSAASMKSPMNGKKMAYKSPHTGPSINKTSGAALT